MAMSGLTWDIGFSKEAYCHQDKGAKECNNAPDSWFTSLEVQNQASGPAQLTGRRGEDSGDNSAQPRPSTREEFQAQHRNRSPALPRGFTIRLPGPPWQGCVLVARRTHR